MYLFTIFRNANVDESFEESCGMYNSSRTPFSGSGSSSRSDNSVFIGGQTFENADHFRDTVKNYAITNNRIITYDKNTWNKIRVKCSDENCEWMISCALRKSDELFAIRKCSLSHTCSPANIGMRSHPQADSNWVANRYMEKLKDDPSYSPASMRKDIQREHGLAINYKLAWRGKETAMSAIHGKEEKSYDRLRWYCEAVEEYNPGSLAEYEVYPDSNKFRRVFICFGPCADGFVRGCRPLIFLDGTHIKNKYKGTLLSAVTKDPNDDLFTIAYAAVDAENDDNWDWFCVKLRSVIDGRGINYYGRFTFFTDRNASLIKALTRVFPDSH